MNATAFNEDGSVDLFHEGHHFHIMLVDCSYGTNPATGEENDNLVNTPEMHCTDEGCDYTCRTTFPLDGDGHAQHWHARVHHAKGKAPDMNQASKEVIAKILDKGGTPRLDPYFMSPAVQAERNLS